MNQLIPVEHKSRRVLTTQQLAEFYGVVPTLISNNHNRNRERYHLGIHYYKLEGQELQDFKGCHQIDDTLKFVSTITLWTEKGALLHAKSFGTDKAWEVYEQLVDTYFRAREMQPIAPGLSPQLQVLINLELQQRQMQLELTATKETVNVIKDTIVHQPDNWRENINFMCNKIAQAIGTDKYRVVRIESYKLLEQRAGVNLERRLINHKARLVEQGKGKTTVDKANKLDCIDGDKKLREIYSKIINEYTIKYLA